MFTNIDLQQMLEDAVINGNNLIDISTDSVSKSHQIHNKDMVAEKMSTEVAEARPRCSCTSSPICHSCRTRCEHFNWAAAKWISFTRRLLGVTPPTRRSKMHLRGKGKLILC